MCSVWPRHCSFQAKQFRRGLVDRRRCETLVERSHSTHVNGEVRAIYIQGGVLLFDYVKGLVRQRIESRHARKQPQRKSTVDDLWSHPKDTTRQYPNEQYRRLQFNSKGGANIVALTTQIKIFCYHVEHSVHGHTAKPDYGSGLSWRTNPVANFSVRYRSS